MKPISCALPVFRSIALVSFVVVLLTQRATGQSTAFTYQGRLNDGGTPADGSYDLRFALFDAASGGAAQRNPLTNSATAVSNGLFTVTLNFGNQFPGADRWLEIAVRTNGAANFNLLSPRQPLTATPYAVRAANAATAATASSVAAANITGTIPLTQLPPTVITNGANGGNITGIDLLKINSHGALAFTTNWGNFSLTASLPVGNNPFSVTTADVNGDGKIDLISGNYGDSSLTVLTNDGTANFVLSSSPGVGSGPRAVTSADVNGDGKVDLISANDNAGTLSVLTNNGSGSFGLASTPGVGSNPRDVTAADLNGDGKVDLISADAGSSTLTILTNNGSGVFVVAASPSAGSQPVSVTSADVNGDGKVDLISANSNASTLSVLTNNGNGAFGLAASPSVGFNPQSVTAADLNGDGKADLASANYNSGTVTVLTNNGTGNFVLSSSPQVGFSPSSVTAADVNADGKLDLIVANTGSLVAGNTLTILGNNGTGGFSHWSSPIVDLRPIWVTAADVNGDGIMDLVSANYLNRKLNVLLNSPAYTTFFTGDGSGLSSLNAANLTGTVADARLSANIARLNAIQTFTGTNSFTGGNVGIGTTSPQSRLHIHAAGGTQNIRFSDSNTGNYWYIYLDSFNNSDNLIFKNSVGAYMGVTWGNGAVFASSDARLKTDIAPLHPVLDRVLQLQPVSYRFTNNPAGSPKTLGFLAQDVEQTFPEAVRRHEGLLGVAYTDLIPVTFKAIQEQNAMIQDTTDEIRQLKLENTELKVRLEKLERLLESQMDGAHKN